MTNNIFTYGVTDIIRRLGQDTQPGGRHTSDRWRINHINDLIAGSNFPEPLPLRERAGDGVTSQVQPRSRWIASAVENWFDGLLPASAIDAADRAGQLAAANDMDNRAHHLQLVDAGQGDAA